MLQTLKSILKNQEDEYTELVMSEEEAKHVPIVVEKLENFACADRVVSHLREGKVVFARIGEFKHTNVDELRRTLSKIRNVCQAINGDIVGIKDEWVIAAPGIARIERAS